MFPVKIGSEALNDSELSSLYSSNYVNSGMNINHQKDGTGVAVNTDTTTTSNGNSSSMLHLPLTPFTNQAKELAFHQLIPNCNGNGTAKSGTHVVISNAEPFYFDEDSALIGSQPSNIVKIRTTG